MLLTEYNEIERDELLLKQGRKEGMEKGVKQGKLEAILGALGNMMNSLKLSFEQAAEILKIPANEYDVYRKALNRPKQ